MRARSPSSATPSTTSSRSGASVLAEIRAKVEAGTRLDRAEGRWLLTEAPPVEVGALAQEAPFQLHPERPGRSSVRPKPDLNNTLGNRLPVYDIWPLAS